MSFDKITAPVLQGTSIGGDVRDLIISGHYAFLADFYRSFTSLDTSNAKIPVVRASTPGEVGGVLEDIAVSGNFALGAAVNFAPVGASVIDFTMPATPQARSIINFTDVHNYGTGIAADAKYLFLTGAYDPHEDSLVIENGVIGDTRLYIAKYRDLEDVAGIAPTVSITSPQNGDSVIQGSQISISAQAADDIAVASVTFTINGADVYTDTVAPFEAIFSLPDNIVNLTIGAEAVDFGGNSTSSDRIEITVIPDPLTTVTGRVLDRNGAALADARVTCVGIGASTNAEGSFSIPGLETVLGKQAVRQ